jgi:hypothetical protein
MVSVSSFATKAKAVVKMVVFATDIVLLLRVTER